MASLPEENRAKKRGPLLPRGDLTNKSPEEDDDGGIGKGTSLKLTSTANVNKSTKPPQPPPTHQPNNANNNKRKASKHHLHLPVKSSGYGRPASRPSTPIHRRPPPSGSGYSYSVPGSPANSVNSVSNNTSSLLRHGDGSLAGTIIGGANNSNSNSRYNFKKSSNNNISSSGSGSGSGIRSRSSPGPAPTSSRRGMRSRTPSPLVKRRVHRSDDDDELKLKLSARKNSQGQLGSATKKIIKHHQQHHELHPQLLSSPQTRKSLPNKDYKDYSQFDSDPTPVKEARRLSCIFQNRANDNQPLSLASPALNDYLMSSPLARNGNCSGSSNYNNDNAEEAPLSYSKVLRKGLDRVVDDESLAGSAMKLFRSSDDTNINDIQSDSNNNSSNAQSQSSHSHTSNNALTLLFESYTDPNQSSTTTLSARLFSRQSGIDTPNLQRLLTKSNNKDTKQWELKKRLENKQEELVILRTVMGDLLSGKEEFVNGAIGIEKGLRNKIAEMLCFYETLSREKTALEKEVQNEKDGNEALKEQVQQLIRERDSYKTKYELLSSELGSAKEEVGRLNQTQTENAIVVALLETKLIESNKQTEEALGRVCEVEAANDVAVKEAQSKMAEEMNGELVRMRGENDTLKTEMQVRKDRERRICRLLNVDVALVDFYTADTNNHDEDDDNDSGGGGEVTNLFMDTIKQRIEDYQKDLNEKKELETSLESCMVELEKAEDDYQSALKTIATKEREMSELMKSIGDIQRTGQIREQEVANQRKAAEDRASDAVSQIAECREQLLLLEYEKKSMEKALEASKAACTAHENTIATLTRDLGEKEKESKLAAEMAVELSKLELEKASLQTEVKVRQGREEKICKMMNVTTLDSTLNKINEERLENDAAASCSEGIADPFLNSIEQRLEEYQKDVIAKQVLEKDLEVCKVEFEKAKSDHQAALETIATKERDMSELMKSIGDIQRSGQDREKEVAKQRKAAEERATAAETQIVDFREKLLSFSYEKKLLEEALETSKATCTSQASTITTLQKEIADSTLTTVQNDSQLQLERDLRAKAEGKESEERAERIALAAQLNAQLQEHAQSQKRLRELMEDTERSLREEICAKDVWSKLKEVELDKCKETIAALEAQQVSLKQSLSEQKSLLDASKEEEIGRLKGEIASLESKLNSEAEKLQTDGAVSKAKMEELEEIIRKGRAERKRLHNIIQDLRGNVRVFARIRPFLPDDDEEGGTPSISHEGDSVVTVAKPNTSVPSHKFTFDRVFAPSAGQEVVFDEVSEFVQSALDGYNVCLFSYGQTGSGKTHTTQGTGIGVMRGLIPRSIEQVATHKTQLEEDGWIFNMEISILEIYNETLKDLLRENEKVESKHEIKVGTDGRRRVTNLTIKSVDPNDKPAIETVLALAAKRRSTASTDMNATSSRSHSVFTLNMTAKHSEKNQMVRGTLNLVDLAGSERLDRSGAEGQQAKEAMAINKSLSSLADVFTAIGQKQSHVPFRNSRLTYLLQPALSGDGKTLMICNISPTVASVHESLCSLRFASKVNKCELGKAKRTIEEVKSNGNAGASKRGSATVVTSSKSGGAGVSSRSVKRKV